MSSNWEDFKDKPAKSKKPEKHDVSKSKEVMEDSNDVEAQDCDWGFNRQGAQTGESAHDIEQSNEASFIKIYERFLHDKESISSLKTKNQSMYLGSCQKTLRDWFDREDQELEIETDQSQEGGYISTINLPIGEHDFAITSESNKKRQASIDEVCSLACIMLDECQMLYSWESNSNFENESDRKRRFNEANKEDDIALDNTRGKKVCCRYPDESSPHLDKDNKVASGSLKRGVNTYESLMAKWNDLNKSIISSKAELVKLDLSLGKSTRETTDSNRAEDDGSDEGSEIDPLDAYMSELETKKELSRDDKIEKSRLKSQIASYEREQKELSRLIELAKPSFDISKAIRRPNS